MRRRRWLLVVAVLVVLALAGGALAWWQAGRSDPVAPDAAVAAFRSDPGPPAPAGSLPLPGVYGYAVTGWECGGFGPICLRRDLPAGAELTLRRAGGGVQERLFLSEQHGEGRSLVRGDGGWRLAEQWSDLQFLGLGQQTTDTAEPQPLVLPDDLAVGASWREQYRLRSVPVEATARVVRSETVQVGGQPVDTVVIATDTTLGGALAGTFRETTWYAPSLGVDVRRQVSRRIDGSFRYELELDARLLDAIPRR